MSEQSPNDDAYEIEVAEAPAQKPRPRRAENPAVDETIHSGEISLPRSMIVRSASSPAIPQQPPEHPVTPAPGAAPPAVASPLPAPHRRSLWFVWLALAVSAGAAAVVFGSVKPTVIQPAPPHTIEADTTAQLVGTTLDGAARAALMRVEAIVQTPMLRAGIQTDAKTLGDMASDRDLVFPHAAGETIEVFQTGASGRALALRIPSDAAAVTPPAVGATRIEQRGDGLVVVADAAITSSATNAAAGEVVLVAPIDLSLIQKRPYEQLTGVQLAGFDKPIALGGGASVANGALVIGKVETTTGKTPALEVDGTIAVPPAVRQPKGYVLPVRVGCAGFAFAMLIVFGISLRRR